MSTGNSRWTAAARSDIEGHLHVHALFIDADADAVVSSKGSGACGTISVLWGHVTAGAGYQYGGGVHASSRSRGPRPHPGDLVPAPNRAPVPAGRVRLPGAP